ncbi:hypothetical protein LINPERPRIM_LOCUS37690 [Linum perenne]
MDEDFYEVVCRGEPNQLRPPLTNLGEHYYCAVSYSFDVAADKQEGFGGHEN